MKLAKTAGFCWGVERALDIALDTANEASGPVFTHGPLIHNPQTVELLKEKNVHVSDPAGTPGSGGLLVIRAHGISPQVRERLRGSGAAIRDATCPLVAKVHGIIRKHSRQGAFTVIIGERGHPEVEGHTGYAEAGSRLVTCLEDVEELPPFGGEVVVVAQTTINMGEWGHVVDAIQAKYPQAQMFNTICDATEVRQEEVRKLAPDVDLMVVVGGRNSGNTNRLAEVAREAGAEAVLIETEAEIDPGFIQRFKRIGVTAGASTPDWMIRRVVNRIEAIPDPRASLRDRLSQGLKVLSRANVLLMLTAGLGAVAAQALGGFPRSGALVAVAALYLFCLHTLNRCTSYEADRYNEPNRSMFYERHRGLLIGASALAGAAALGLAAWVSPPAAALLAAGLVLGLFFSLRLEPRALKMGRVLNFPASKTMVVTAGWTVTLALLPAAAFPDRAGPGAAVAALFVFGLVLFRAGLVELRDIQGDRIVGKRTLPIVLGKEQTEAFLGAVCAALAVLLWAGAANGHVAAPVGWAMLAPVAYSGLSLWLFKRRILGHGGLTEAAVDLHLVLAGLLALAIAW
ncbi:MAG: 4-hydroxy-3-methylbut-2-enyl diphosphate reductase [Candidatus Tectomicrobia bacterium]|uniref:4-hydroxy-3-methylbut-2-enyl diphosphate reductase n=1 Tax=Tectimicrobiota bacterium TaxID=2528274 RepID=A0A932MQ71_UNCTE|nr:4-hydroxy-3-methylbut-2-enyl diphosphate reductase [Candidatus Tectomicrobia bacterium]